MNQKDKTDKLWADIVEDVRSKGSVGEYGFDAYISKLGLRCDTGTKLIVEYPEDMLIDWVEMNYLPDMQAAAARVLDGARQIELVPQHQGHLGPVQEQKISPASAATCGKRTRTSKPRVSRRQNLNTGLNADFSFENFVVGPNSEFAYNAARSIVDSPCSLHNPLVISGASGIGKTHLMQAIGNALLEKDENAQVLYITSEEFTNAYIDALSRHGEGLASFRRKYRKADVLLIDDVQFLADKDKTQTEFFHTFNALLSSGKQIVLTMDCAPSQLTTLDARLTSRFEQGLTVALNPPELETRLAILRAKCRQWNTTAISDEVLYFMAKNITCSVRRMEGALVRVISFSSFSHRSPNLADVRSLLGDFLVEERASKSFSVDSIQRAVAKEFEVRVEDLTGPRRTANIAQPRQLAMYLARQHTGLSLQDIGLSFGGRDHGTVIHATKAVETRLSRNSALKDVISRVLLSLD